MQRRHFLQDFLAGTVLLVAGLVPYGVARFLAPVTSPPKRNYLRPPGALAQDAQFIAACIGCGLCGEVCPPRCIRFHKRDGGSNVNIPFIKPDEKACLLCAKCMDVCPTNALTPLETKNIDMGIAQIDRTACYPWVDRGICGACVSICPLGSHAIDFKLWNQYKPFIKSGCVGCGLCVESCPHPSTPIWVVKRPKETMKPIAS